MWTSPEITRLDEYRDRPQDVSENLSESFSKKVDEKEELGHRRAAACRFLTSMVSTHPNRCVPTADSIPRLLRDDHAEVQLAALELLSQMYRKGIDRAPDPIEYRRDIERAVEETKREQGWVAKILPVMGALFGSEDTERKELGSSLSGRVIDHLEEEMSMADEPVHIYPRLVTLVTTCPTPPVIEYVLSENRESIDGSQLDKLDSNHRRFLEELPIRDPSDLEEALVRALCGVPGARGLLQEPHIDLRRMLESKAPVLVAEGEVDRESVEQAVHDTDPKNGVTERFEDALDEAQQ